MSILRFKILVIFIFDIVAMFSSLAISLLFRYGLIAPSNLMTILRQHLIPFSIIFAIWLLVFYILELYKEKNLKINIKVFNTLFIATVINISITVLYFYLLAPIFQITPKTNLLILGSVFLIIGYLIRAGVITLFTTSRLRNKMILIGDSQSVAESVEYIEKNPQLRCEVKRWLKNGVYEAELDEITNTIKDEKVDTVVVQPQLMRKESVAKIIYRMLPLNVRIFDFADFYESIFHRVPIEDVEERWFVEEVTMGKHLYDIFKRLADIIISFLALIIFLPLMFVIIVLIKTTSRGGVYYTQKRVGKNGRIFTLYKFRTMVRDAERNGAQWAQEKDRRVTFIGRILRRTHLDELPQLINVLKGESSLIGPRPERPEFVEDLEKKIPYYDIRHLIKPGITGWAQINFPYTSSVEDSRKKLQYDIYYLKNRSFTLDIIILMNTTKFLFKKAKKT